MPLIPRCPVRCPPRWISLPAPICRSYLIQIWPKLLTLGRIFPKPSRPGFSRWSRPREVPMHSTTSSLLPHLAVLRSRPIQHVPGLASLTSLASSASREPYAAMQRSAVRCNPNKTVITHHMTQAWNAGGHSDASRRAGCFTTPVPMFAHVCAVLRPVPNVGPRDATAARRPTRANVAYHAAFPPIVGTTKNRAGVLASGNRHGE